METQENMSAEESRRIALAVQQDLNSKEMVKVFFKIKNARKGGKLSISVPQGSLSNAAISNLKVLEYKVESVQTGMNEYDYTINWV